MYCKIGLLFKMVAWFVSTNQNETSQKRFLINYESKFYFLFLFKSLNFVLKSCWSCLSVLNAICRNQFQVFNLSYWLWTSNSTSDWFVCICGWWSRCAIFCWLAKFHSKYFNIECQSCAPRYHQSNWSISRGSKDHFK